MRAWLKRCVDEIRLRLPQRQAVDPLFYACAFIAAASLVLGGGARSGHLRDAILALLSIPLFALGYLAAIRYGYYSADAMGSVVLPSTRWPAITASGATSWLAVDTPAT